MFKTDLKSTIALNKYRDQPLFKCGINGLVDDLLDAFLLES